MEKSDFDEFQYFLEDKIVNSDDQNVEIVIDWHGYGLQRGIIGKKHALKIYDLFALITSYFWGSTGSNITPVVQLILIAQL